MTALFFIYHPALATTVRISFQRPNIFVLQQHQVVVYCIGRRLTEDRERIILIELIRPVDVAFLKTAFCLIVEIGAVNSKADCLGCGVSFCILCDLCNVHDLESGFQDNFIAQDNQS